MANSIKLELNIEETIKKAATRKPALSMLHQGDTFGFSEHFVLTLLLNDKDPAIRNWYRSRIQKMRDIEFVKSLTPADGAEKLIALIAVGEGQAIVNKEAEGDYKAIIEKWQKHEDDLTIKKGRLLAIEKERDIVMSQEKKTIVDLEKKQKELETKKLTLGAVNSEIEAINKRLKKARGELVEL